jgi:uncharacterized protein YukE
VDLDAAAATCRAVAAAVDEAAMVRAHAAGRAQDGWRGPARERFDAELAVLQREAAALADDLRSAAGAIALAAEAERAATRPR